MPAQLGEVMAIEKLDISGTAMRSADGRLPPWLTFDSTWVAWNKQSGRGGGEMEGE